MSAAATLERPDLATAVTQRAVLHFLRLGGPARTRDIAATLQIQHEDAAAALDTLALDGLTCVAVDLWSAV